MSLQINKLKQINYTEREIGVKTSRSLVYWPVRARSVSANQWAGSLIYYHLFTGRQIDSWPCQVPFMFYVQKHFGIDSLKNSNKYCQRLNFHDSFDEIYINSTFVVIW